MSSAMPKILSKRNKRLKEIEEKIKQGKIKAGKCDDCPKRLPLHELYRGLCPFVSEVFGRDRAPRVTLCPDCYKEAVWSI